MRHYTAPLLSLCDRETRWQGCLCVLALRPPASEPPGGAPLPPHRAARHCPNSSSSSKLWRMVLPTRRKMLVCLFLSITTSHCIALHSVVYCAVQGWMSFGARRRFCCPPRTLCTERGHCRASRTSPPWRRSCPPILMSLELLAPASPPFLPLVGFLFLPLLRLCCCLFLLTFLHAVL